MSDESRGAETPKDSPLGLVLALVRPFRWHSTAIVVGALVAGLAEAFFLVAVTRVALAIAGGADKVSLTTKLSLELTPAVLVCAAVLVLRMAGGLMVAFLQTSVMYRVTVAIRQRLVETYFGAPWETASAVAPGEFQQIIVEYPARATSVTAKVTTLMSNGLSLATLIATSSLVDWQSTLLVVASLSVLSTLILPLRRIIGRRSRLSAGKQLELANEVDEARSILLEATTFGATRDVATSLSKLGRESAEANRRLSVAINVSPQIYSTLAYVSVLVALGFASGLGGENLDGVGAVMLIMLRALGYGQQIQSGAVALMEMVPYLGRINDFVKGFDSLERRQGDLPLPPRANLSLSAVSFKYPDREAAFSNFDLNVDFGKSVAVIGPSGSGKSTLLQLLLGIRRPTSGGIRFGDNDLQMISEEDFRRKVAFVPQATTLVSGTILDNVRFFRPWVDDSMVDDALRRAGIVDEVASLPSGVNTEIGSLGNRLSGGQRQRIAIARALAGKPSFLLMDEPTSALDSESEALIAQLINSLRGVCTVIVVAHRPGTIEACEVTVTVQKPD